jgi:type IV pilus assembly protein PilC
MVQYTYKAIDRRGKKISGHYDASGIEDLESRLDKQGLDLISANLKGKEWSLFFNKSVERRDLIIFFIDLEQMAVAGIPIVDSLIEIRDSASSPAMREITTGLVDNISNGQTLSQAMSNYPKAFNEMMVKLIIAGEQTGNLGHIFGELKETLRWQEDVIRKTKKLMTYPLFVGVIVFAVVCFLMIYLVPKLVDFILSMDQEVPMMTKLLIAVSDIFVNHWIFILFLPPILYFSGKLILKRSSSARYWFDEYKLKLPLLGEAMQKLMLSRFTRNFSLLYESGISVLDCLKISQETVTNSYLSGELQYIRKQVEEGATIADAFSRGQLFPPLVLRMIQVGEMTGGLGQSLSNVSDFYSRDVTDLIDKIQAMIEPFMTVFMGLILGWIMLAVLGPIYDMISTVQF